MSHFSTIQTQIKDRPALLEALNLLGHYVQEDVKLENPLDHTHKQWQVDVAVGDDIGFRLNKEGVYELVTDLQTWKQPIPPERFVDKLTQQYARMVIHQSVKEMGLSVAEEWEMDDNSIELTVTNWN
tara:strand:+ start:924 stop:1304 length:381 start_codon:yes stop_codon:yes gene_type:complete